MRKPVDQVGSLLFKQVPGGYVFRAPNPKVFGHSQHYLVNAAQRDEIVAIMAPRRPMFSLVVWISGFILALGATVVSLLALIPDYPITVFLALTAAMLLVAILALHLSASRTLRRLQPVLAGAAQTDQQVTIAEIRQGLNEKLSYRQLLIAGISNAVACVASVAAVAVLTYFRKQHGGIFANPLALLFCFNAIILGLSSASSFHGAVRKSEHAEGMRPAHPIFTMISRHLISAYALVLLVFLSAAAWIGLTGEFSDQSKGQRYEDKGEHDNAIASFSKAIAAEPGNSEAYLDRAKSYSAKGDHDRAIADYSKAIEIEPGDAVVYRKRADAYRVKGALGNAIADYDKALELDPADAFAYYFRGVSHAANKSGDRAIADFTKAIEINPKDAHSYVARARSLEAKGDHDHAAADFGKAIEINPKYYYAYFFRAYALDAQGEHDRAIADFAKAIEIDPKNAVAYRGRAAAYTRTGARNLAIADYRTIQELPALTDADRQGQEYARQRIDQLTSTPIAPEGTSTNAPLPTPR